jgi:aspartate/glutamate racemase
VRGCAPNLFDHSRGLCANHAAIGTDQQYNQLRQIAHTILERDKVEAIILAGTELSLLFNEANTDFPHIDAARLHVSAIMCQPFAETADNTGDLPGAVQIMKQDFNY